MTDAPKKPEEAIDVINAPVDDAQGQQLDLRAPPSGDAPQPREEIKPEIVQEDGRAAIAARFKKLRSDKEPGVDTTGDFIHPSQTYGQVAVEPEPEAPKEPQGDAPPAKITLKVRGEQREVDRDEALRLARVVVGNDEDVSSLSNEQITRLAQIGAAGQSYLDDTKQVLETTRTRVQVSRQHPDAPESAPTANQQDEPDDRQHPDDPIEALVNDLQFGDPKEAGPKLRTTIAEIAADAVKQATVTDRVQQDVANDMRAHDEFVKKYADLASDPIATSVIRDQLMNGYREDLRKIGVPEENIPSDPTALANHHRHYKLQGQPVRQVAQLLNHAAETYQNWRGGTPRTEATPQSPSEPRVEVNLNRDDRRRAIPQQPTRANVQPQMTAPQQQGPRSRHDAVKEAQRARGQAV